MSICMFFFRVEAGVGGELGFLEYVGSADGGKVLPGALDHGLQEGMFLGCTVRLPHGR